MGMISNFSNWQKLNENESDRDCKFIKEESGTLKYTKIPVTGVMIDGEASEIEVRRFPDGKLEFLDLDGYHLVDLGQLQWYRFNVEETNDRLDEIYNSITNHFKKLTPFQDEELNDVLNYLVQHDDLEEESESFNIQFEQATEVKQRYRDYRFDCPLNDGTREELVFRFLEGTNWPEFMVDGAILPQDPGQDDIYDTYGNALNELMDDVAIGNPDNRYPDYR